MSTQRAIQVQRPRELRRRVMLGARMRAGATWTDACILNVSSHGLMINAPSAGPRTGTMIEIRHADHVIVAAVVWRNGTRAGLRSEHRVPVEEILALGNAPSLRLTAGQWPQIDRRKHVRSHSDNRLLARALEFAGVAAIAASLGFGALFLVQQAFARPMMALSAALGR